MASYLSAIIETHVAAAAADGRDVASLVEEALETGEPRPFAAALADRTRSGLAVVAEVKRRSPSRGNLAPELDPAALARRYAEGGARAISVLTDAHYFGGSPEDLQQAKGATGLPVLRKDFTVGPADVCDTRIMGADAVLLIVAALDPAALAELHALAWHLGLDALVEVHDEVELERALDLGAKLVGVNQRDLSTFEVDPRRGERLVRSIPDGIVTVAESGVRGADDARRLADAGFDAVLVGESLVCSRDPAQAVRALSARRVADRTHRVEPRSRVR